MVWHRVSIAALAGVLAATAALPTWAGVDQPAAPPPGGTPAGGPPPAAPATTKVWVREWVPENYQCTRTVYRTECREETYTAYRCECVPETRTRVCTLSKLVPETRTVTRTVCVAVPCVEERTVMQARTVCKPVCETVRKCVDRGHWECREVPRKPGLLERLCKRNKDCCDPCCPPPTKTVRVWVPCPVWEEKVVTRMKRVTECVPVTCKVTVYKQELRQQECQVTCYKCVPEQRTETVTVMAQKMIPYQAKRMVPVCVPHQETVTCCRMVCRMVEKEMPVQACCCAIPAWKCDAGCGGKRRHARCCN